MSNGRLGPNGVFYCESASVESDEEFLDPHAAPRAQRDPLFHRRTDCQTHEHHGGPRIPSDVPTLDLSRNSTVRLRYQTSAGVIEEGLFKLTNLEGSRPHKVKMEFCSVDYSRPSPRLVSATRSTQMWMQPAQTAMSIRQTDQEMGFSHQMPIQMLHQIQPSLDQEMVFGCEMPIQPMVTEEMGYGQQMTGYNSLPQSQPMTQMGQGRIIRQAPVYQPPPVAQPTPCQPSTSRAVPQMEIDKPVRVSRQAVHLEITVCF